MAAIRTISIVIFISFRMPASAFSSPTTAPEREVASGAPSSGKNFSTATSRILLRSRTHGEQRRSGCSHCFRPIHEQPPLGRRYSSSHFHDGRSEGLCKSGEESSRSIQFKDFDGQPKKFREIGPLVYLALNGQDRLAFKRDASGRLYFAMDYPFMIFQRVGWLQGEAIQLLRADRERARGAADTLILWPVAALVRRHYRTEA